MIKKYSDFIKELVSYGKDMKSQLYNGDIKYNASFRSFKSDLILIRDFITSHMGNQGLKLNGYGYSGFVFDWYKVNPMPESFIKNTEGNINNNSDSVIKVTVDFEEGEFIRNLIAAGSIDGLVNYRWVCAINKPNNFSFKSLQYTNNNAKRKTNIIYIICMDKVKKLNNTEDIIMSAFGRRFNINFTKNSNIKINDDDIQHLYENYQHITDIENFKDFCRKIIKLYDKIDTSKLEQLGLISYDMHGGNVGYDKSGDLVVYDIAVPVVM